jgi:hypothetical protein
MLGENPNTKKLFFNKILCALMVKGTKEGSRGLQKRGHRGGGRPKDAFTLSIQDVLCGLCG